MSVWFPDDLIDVVVKARVNALMTGAFGDAAKLSEYLTEAGVQLTDTNEGTHWKRVKEVTPKEQP